MSVKVISYPTVEPITLEEARQHLRIDTYGSPPEHPDDALIQSQLSAAREWCEQYLGIAVANQTIDLVMDEFPDAIELPIGPVVSVDYIRYLDAEGVETTIELPDYIYDSYTGRILPGLETPWPVAQDVVNAVTVRYQAGYSLPTESPIDVRLPYAVRAAILLILGDLYESRENSSSEKMEQVPMAAQTLLDMTRVRRGFA